MKKTIILFLFSLLFFMPSLVEAYQGQYSWDPLYFKEVEGPFDSFDKQLEKSNAQQNANQQTKNRLKSWYGLTNYYDCYNSYCTGDLSNPYTMAGCLISVEYCLERKQMQDERIEECDSKAGYYWNGQCVTKDQGCKNKYGQYSYYTGEGFVCDCITGYEWQGDVCVIKQAQNQEKIEVGKIYFDPDELCKDNYGQYSVYTGNQSEEGNYICDCQSGYEWNPARTQCIVKQESEPEVLGIQIDMTLTERLKGKLLLQVEARGAIWYVDTNDLHRYNVTWTNALPLFKKLSLGITDANLAKVPIAGSSQTGDWSMRNRLKGKLLLQVEQRGAIWYVDYDGYRHSVTWDNLLPLFQSLALGITNSDLSKIPTGSLEGF